MERVWSGGGAESAVLDAHDGAMESVLGEDRPMGVSGGRVIHKSYPKHINIIRRSHPIEPFAYVRALLVALSSDEVDLESLLPDVWIAAHPEHVLQYRRDEAEATANARRRRRALRREKARGAEPES